MVFVPKLALGIIHGWLFFAAYLIVFGITIRIFPEDVRKRLYDRSRWTQKQKTLTAVGKLFTIANLVLFVLSPIRFGTGVFIAGVALWAVGLLALEIALVNYRNTPMDVPVTRGLYRISRNPQIFGVWLLFTGICLIIGSWLSLIIHAVSLVLLHRSVLAEEEACLDQYGDAYRELMRRAPRYFVFV